MSSITTGGKTTTYAYDADGIRTTKVVGGVTHEYLTLNGKVVYEKIGTGATAKIMVFTYDAQGRPFAVKYSKNNGESFTNYFYALNLQGDVVKIFRPVSVKDADGNITGYTEKTYATYSYNAWGELTGITDSNGNSILNKQTTSNALANLNPLRYRGYYYDNETGFYYLQSRYYDPANHRFLNADIFTSTDSTDAVACNMFVYCGNNPVTEVDPTGEWSLSGVLAGLATIAVGVAAAVVTVATAGAAAPIAAAAISTAGTLISSAIITTGTTVTYAAATDSTAVIELGTNICHERSGLCFVMDFKGGDNDSFELYGRNGWTSASGADVTYSAGIIEDYQGKNSYAEEFVSTSLTVKSGYSIDYGQSPRKKLGSGPRAVTASFSVGTSSSRFTTTYDYYMSIHYWK